MTARTDSFEGLHVLLVTDDDARAQAIAKSLRERKAHVGDVRAGSRDPVALRGADLLVIDARRGAATDARVAEVRSDVRARWASVATIDYTQLAGGDGTVDLRALEGIVSRLAGMDKALTERARRESSFEMTLAPLGPTRTLRALALAGPTLHVSLSDGTLKASVDLADELLVASFAERNGERWEAWTALAHVLGLTDANVTVERRAHPSAMNIMEPVDQALEGAAQERAKAPQLFNEHIEELSGLHVDRREEKLSASLSQAASQSAAPRARTLVGVAPPVPPPAALASSARPGPARPSAARSNEEDFSDVPTGQAAPGLLQRMARAPANDAPATETAAASKGTATATPAAEAPASTPPVLTVEPTDEDDSNDDFDAEGEQYDAGEVTVVADSSQLDILRETLAGLEGHNKPLTPTIPAPPGPSSTEVETSATSPKPSEPNTSDSLVQEFVSQRPVDEVAGAEVAAPPASASKQPSEAANLPAPTPASTSTTSTAVPRAPATPAGVHVTKSASGSSRWLVMAAIVIALLALAAFLATRSASSEPAGERDQASADE